MAEARRDPLTGRWVILSPGRADRPQEPGPSPAPATPGKPVGCPFCPGHEHETPPEVARRGAGDPNGPGWQVRVVPNLHPIVHGVTGPELARGDPLRQRRAAGGAHEVAIVSPAHDRSLGQLDDGEVLQVLLALRDRALAHASSGHRYTQIMVNHGPDGGASLAHPHAQIVAIDIPPPTVEEEVAHMSPGGECLLCRELQHLDDASLDVGAFAVAGQEALLWCPWWSSTAYELLLAPRRHRPRFEDSGSELEAVAVAVRQGLHRLDRRLGDPSYNLMVHTRPADVQADYHWHIHIRPRLQVEAGFELGTGLLVNIVDPAEAAKLLR